MKSGVAGLPTDFWRLWGAAATSNIGDGIRLTALPLLIATITRDPLLVSGVTAATLLPWLLFSLPGGAIVDRVDRRRLMILGQLARAAMVATLALVVLNEGTTVWLVYLTGFVIGTGEVFVDTSLQASIPMLVPESQLENANSKFLAVEFVANDAVGGPLGAWLFAAMAALPFGIDAISFLLGALLIRRIRVPLQETRDITAPRMWASIKEGVDFLKTDVLLRRLAFAVAGANLAMGGGGAILVLLALDVLGLSEFGFGLLVGSGAVGGFIGAVSARRISARVGRRLAMTGGALLLGGGQIVLGLAPNGIVAVAGFLVSSFGVSLFSVVGRALRQAVTPDRILGRVVTSFRLIGIGSVPVGALSAGFLANLTGIRVPYIAGSVVLTIVAFAIYMAATDDRINHSLARRTAGTSQ